MNKIGILAGALVVLLIMGFLEAHERRAQAEVSARADSLASELVAERARADGWAVTFARATGSLLGELAKSDSQIARLGRDLEAARARPLARTSVTAVAAGSVRVEADTVRADTAEGTLRDGPLWARWRFELPAILTLPRWEVTVPIELVHAQAGLRLMVFARSPDPHVSVTVDSLLFQLPGEPQRGFPWRCAGAAGGSGGLFALKPTWWTALLGAGVTWFSCR